MLMAVSSEHILVTPENREKLKKLGNTGDTYNHVITKLLENHELVTSVDLTELIKYFRDGLSFQSKPIPKKVVSNTIEKGRVPIQC